MPLVNGTDCANFSDVYLGIVQVHMGQDWLATYGADVGKKLLTGHHVLEKWQIAELVTFFISFLHNNLLLIRYHKEAGITFS